MNVVVGLDLSLTSTGVARIVDGKAAVGRVRPKNIDGHERLEFIREDVAGWVYEDGQAPGLVVIEGPSYGSPSGSQRGHHERAGLWWLVTQDLWMSGVRVAVVPPTQLKTYATGKGNAGKDDVLTAVVRRFPDVAVRGNDDADALVLAAMGADHLGQPLVTMPAEHRKALAKVEWPAVAS